MVEEIAIREEMREDNKGFVQSESADTHKLHYTWQKSCKLRMDLVKLQKRTWTKDWDSGGRDMWKIETSFVETVEATFENTLCFSYCDWNETIEPSSLKIADHAVVKVVRLWQCLLKS